MSRTVDEALLLYASGSHNEEREQISVSIATSGVRLREQSGKPETSYVVTVRIGGASL
jgi:hypothetical protein